MSDYKFLIESRLSPAELEVLSRLSRGAAKSGINLYLVGGVVRDLTCGQPIRNLDFSVEGRPREILRQLRKEEILFLDYGERGQTAELVFANGVKATVSMARTKKFTRLGARPVVAPAVIFEDLRRRDFSINAMAISLNPNSLGLFLDPANGVADLERRKLRALYNRSFWDDPVRVFRLFRLGIRMKFRPDSRTQSWLERALEDRTTARLRNAQQGKELRDILQENKPDRVLSLLAEKGILGDLDNSLLGMRIPRDEFKTIRRTMQKLPPVNALPLNFYCLTRKMGPEKRRHLARKIINIPAQSESVLGLRAERKKLTRALRSGRKRPPSQVYDLLSSKPLLLLIFTLLYTTRAPLRRLIKNFFFKKVPLIRNQVPRAQLEAAGIPPGPALEAAGDHIFRLMLDGKVRTQPQISQIVKSLTGKAKAAKKSK